MYFFLVFLLEILEFWRTKTFPFIFRGLIEKPPVGGKELTLLNQLQLTGFRLHPGPLPEQYRSQSNPFVLGYFGIRYVLC